MLNIKKGFTLIELILVISVGTSITFASFQQMLKTYENNQAKAVGQEIKQIGNSVNSYIALHYDKLSTLQNSDGTTQDTGPRTCSISTSTCSINLTTLKNEGLLPQTYANTNLFGSEYTLILKRSGAAPYYNVTGLITTNETWKINNGIIKYDLLGQAILEAGIDSGMSKDNANVINGYKGLWNHTSAEFSNINKQGQLAYQVGYGSYSYSIYLRRDGSLPMTGNLNMGAKSINNVMDINGSGNLTMTGTGNFGGEVTAKDGYGDTITLGGDAFGNDYELRLGRGKPLSIYSPNAAPYSTVLSVNKNMVVGDRLATNGMNPNDLPTGWSGGLRTQDVYAAGTIAAGSGGYTPAYMNASGQIYAANSISTSGNVTVSGSVNVGGNTNTAGETYTGGWFRTRGDTGWYSEKWGGGWHMSDSSWIRSYNNKNVYTGGQVQAGSIQSNGDMNAAGNANVNGGVYTNYLQTNGRLSVGEYAMFNGVAYADNSCPQNGLQSRDTSGGLLSCVNGIWKKNSGSLQSMVWTAGGGSNYGNICQISLNNNGLAAQGWIVTGSDACTEDGESCTTDNVKCFAIKLNNS